MKEASSVHIELDAPRVVLRSGGNSDSDGEPASLSGTVVLKLVERASIKDIQIHLNGRAKLAFNDGPPTYKNHTQEVPVYGHNFSFLSENGSASTGSAKGKEHAHTFNAGLHKFPFNLDVPQDLPPSMRSYTGAAIVHYRLKVYVIRSGFTTGNLTAKHPVTVLRGYGSEAIEFTSTVELDNTWPGKAQYLFTLPHKAHAAGEDIPISIRFVPLAKGVRLRSVHTEIRESLTIIGKGGHQHNESHCIVSHKTDLSDGSHIISRAASRPPSEPLSRISSHNQLSGMSAMSPTESSSSPGVNTPYSTVSGGVAAQDLSRRLAKISAADDRGLLGNDRPNLHHHRSEGPSSPHHQSGGHSRNDPHSQFVQRVQETLAPEPQFEPLDPNDVPPQEAHVVIHMRIPRYACPSDSSQPCAVSHRIKWTCQIENRDLHVSELRCALPIVILDPSFSDEVRLATSGARNLLFGPSGVMVPENEAILQSDLPAYESHTQDRIANSSVTAAPSSYQMNPWASHENTPAVTPFPSRPPSPEAGPSGSRSNADDNMSTVVNDTHNPYFPASPPNGPVPDAHAVSSRLLAGHGQSFSMPTTPADGGGGTPLAGASSGSSSNLASLGSSGGASSSSNSHGHSGSGSGSSLFHLHMPKRRGFSFGRSPAGSSHHRDDPGPSQQQQQQHHYPMSLPATPLNAPSTAPSSPTQGRFGGAAGTRNSLSRSSTGGIMPLTAMTPMTPNPNPSNGEGPNYTNVPPYDLARDWLGGGVVPLSSMRGLPSYEESASTPATAPPSRASSPQPR